MTADTSMTASSIQSIDSSGEFRHLCGPGCSHADPASGVLLADEIDLSAFGAGSDVAESSRYEAVSSTLNDIHECGSGCSHGSPFSGIEIAASIDLTSFSGSEALADGPISALGGIVSFDSQQGAAIRHMEAVNKHRDYGSSQEAAPRVSNQHPADTAGSFRGEPSVAVRGGGIGGAFVDPPRGDVGDSRSYAARADLKAPSAGSKLEGAAERAILSRPSVRSGYESSRETALLSRNQEHTDARGSFRGEPRMAVRGGTTGPLVGQERGDVGDSRSYAVRAEMKAPSTRNSVEGAAGRVIPSRQSVRSGYDTSRGGASRSSIQQSGDTGGRVRGETFATLRQARELQSVEPSRRDVGNVRSSTVRAEMRAPSTRNFVEGAAEGAMPSRSIVRSGHESSREGVSRSLTQQSGEVGGRLRGETVAAVRQAGELPSVEQSRRNVGDARGHAAMVESSAARRERGFMGWASEKGNRVLADSLSPLPVRRPQLGGEGVVAARARGAVEHTPAKMLRQDEQRRIIFDRLSRIIDQASSSAQGGLSVNRLQHIDLASRMLEVLIEEDREEGDEGYSGVRGKRRFRYAGRGRKLRVQAQSSGIEDRAVTQRRQTQVQRRGELVVSSSKKAIVDPKPLISGRAAPVRVASATNSGPSKSLDIFQAKSDDDSLDEDDSFTNIVDTSPRERCFAEK